MCAILREVMQLTNIGRTACQARDSHYEIDLDVLLLPWERGEICGSKLHSANRCELLWDSAP
jgi:hypothetical protein